MLKVHIEDLVNQYDHFVWDWNGTLLDDVDIAVDSIGLVLEKYGLERISVDHYRKLFGFPVYHYYQRLGFDFEKISFEDVTRDFIGTYGSLVKRAQLFEDVHEILSMIKRNQKDQFVLSAGHQEHLNEIIRHFEIFHHFDGVYGINNYYAGSKVERGRELMRDFHLVSDRTLLIGDTDHDLEVGQELNIDVLLVGDGHQSSDRLHALKEASVLSSRRSKVAS